MLRRLKSILAWLDDRSGASATLGPMARHLVPSGAKWWYVFGSATLLAFLVQVLSGVVLAFMYVPSSSQAYESLKFITDSASFGGVMRGLHYYGASAMVLMVGLHMAQVFLAGSYKFPRELNWMTGVLLLGFTMVMGFTGQLLRWDQNAVWSVVVAAEQVGRVPLIGTQLAHFTLGGDTVGGATLSRFFVFHVFIVPGLIFAFVGLHLWLVLRHGIAEPSQPGMPVEPRSYRERYEARLKQSGVPFWPDAVWRDVTFGVGLLAAVLLLAVCVGAPALDLPPDPSIVQAQPRPDWYLLWYFAILALTPPALENYFIVLLPVLVGVGLILLPLVSNRGERTALHRPWAIAAVVIVVLAVGSLWYLGAKSPWSPNFDAPPLSTAIVGTSAGPIAEGAKIFQQKNCLSCHLIAGEGGRRGPDLSRIGDKLSRVDLIVRIVNGGTNMPAYGSILTPAELEAVTTFLESRKRSP